MLISNCQTFQPTHFLKPHPTSFQATGVFLWFSGGLETEIENHYWNSFKIGLLLVMMISFKSKECDGLNRNFITAITAFIIIYYRFLLFTRCGPPLHHYIKPYKVGKKTCEICLRNTWTVLFFNIQCHCKYQTSPTTSPTEQCIYLFKHFLALDHINQK